MPLEIWKGHQERLVQLYEQGKMVVITSDNLNLVSTSNGDSKEDPDNTAVSLLDRDGNVHIHLSVRRQNNYLAVNSRKHNGGWNHEEAVSDLHRLFGPHARNAYIEVENHGTTFQVYINGNFAIEYRRLIDGDEPQYVSYGVNSGYTSVYSNPLTAKVENIPEKHLRAHSPAE